MFTKGIRQYFNYNRRERNGIFLLLFVLIALILLNYTVPYWASSSQTNSNKLAELLKELNDTAADASDTLGKAGEETLIIHFAFNPNTASLDTLIQAGLPAKLAQQVINYREKGGRFKIRKDFAKLYRLTGYMYAAIEPYLLLPDKAEAPKPAIVEINGADSLTLLKVKGLGPFYVAKILKYRRQLGGYFSLNQLGEAFYVNANTLEEQQRQMGLIKSQLRVNASLIQKINIQTAVQSQLSAHPYISYKEAKAIIKHRDKQGINSIEDLKNIPAVTEKTIQLIAPYLEF